MEHQQGTWVQLELKLMEEEKDNECHGASGDGGTETGANEEGQVVTASNRRRALTSNLMKGYVNERT